MNAFSKNHSFPSLLTDIHVSALVLSWSVSLQLSSLCLGDNGVYLLVLPLDTRRHPLVQLSLIHCWLFWWWNAVLSIENVTRNTWLSFNKWHELCSGSHAQLSLIHCWLFWWWNVQYCPLKTWQKIHYFRFILKLTTGSHVQLSLIHCWLFWWWWNVQSCPLKMQQRMRDFCLIMKWTTGR